MIKGLLTYHALSKIEAAHIEIYIHIERYIYRKTHTGAGSCTKRCISKANRCTGQFKGTLQISHRRREIRLARSEHASQLANWPTEGTDFLTKSVTSAG